MYRPNSDLRAALAQVLWKLRSNTSTHADCPVNNGSVNKPHDTTENKCLEELNTLVHSQIKVFLDEDAIYPTDHDNIEIIKLIDKMHPKLW